MVKEEARKRGSYGDLTDWIAEKEGKNSLSVWHFTLLDIFPGRRVGWCVGPVLDKPALSDFEKLGTSTDQQKCNLYAHESKKEFFAVLNYLQPRLLTPLTHSIYSRFNHTRIRRQIRLIGCDKDARSFTKVKDGWHHSKRSSIPWIIFLFVSPLTT